MSTTTPRSTDPRPVPENLDLFGGTTPPGVTVAPHAAPDARAASKPRPIPRSVAGDAAVPVVGDDRTIRVPLACIVAAPWQPRRDDDHAALSRLAASIRAVGMLQPVVVRRVTEPESEHPRYELLAGHRRVAAAREVAGAGQDPTVSALVVDVDEVTARRLTLDENVERAPLSAYERATMVAAVVGAMEAAAARPLTVDDVHAVTGWSTGSVAEYRRVAQRITPDVLAAAGFVGAAGGVDWAAVSALTLRQLDTAAKSETADDRVALLQATRTTPRAVRGGRRPTHGARAGQPAAESLVERRNVLSSRGGLALRLSRPLAQYPAAEARGYAAELAVALGLLASAASGGAAACTLDTGAGAAVVLTKAPRDMTASERHTALGELARVSDMVRGAAAYAAAEA